MLKTFVKKLVSSRPGWAVASRLRRPGLAVLTYHRINRDLDSPFAGLHVDAFRAQMRWLKRSCLPLDPDAALLAMERPTRGRRPVLVTFDDGYRDYHDVAYPILAELGIPALVFVPTAFMDSSRLIWTDQIACAIHHSSVAEVRLPWDSGTRRPLRDAADRSRLLALAKDHLKRLPDLERQATLAELMQALRVPNPEELVERQMMSWAEVRATQPLTTYGGHSHAHGILSSMAPDALKADLTRCTELLHERAGASADYFAYPNGRALDFDAVTQRILRELGYKAAFTTLPGLNGPDADRMALLRMPTSGRHVADFAWLAAGLGG